MAVVRSVDEYIAQFEEPVRSLLQNIRLTIQNAAPEATEKISYGIPTFYERENLIHFAAAKRHIGLYPTSSGIAAFAARLADYHTSRGAIQFPLDQPIPYGLISEIAAFRVREARERHTNR
jgi:uncharacterized protein YdhG (YjbR/CyaY superfamily)